MLELIRGRLDGVHGMRAFTAEELFALAERFERQSVDPANADDPRWLRRWAGKIRQLAEGNKKRHRTRFVEASPMADSAAS